MPAGGRASSAVNICQAPSSAFPSRAPLSAARSLSALRFSEARHESRKLIMLSHLKYPWPGLDRMVCVTGGRSSLLKRCARSLARSLSPGEGPVSWTGPQAGVTRLPTVANGRESLMSAGRNEDVPLEKYRRPAPPPPTTPPDFSPAARHQLFPPRHPSFRRCAALMTSPPKQEPLLGDVCLD